MMAGMPILLFILVVAGAFGQAAGDADVTHKLLQELLSKRPDNVIVPRKNHSQPITIKIGMSLIHLEELDEEHGILYTNMWTRYLWRDDYVQWKPSDYGNVTTLRLRSESLWMPDVKIYNKRKDEEYGNVHAVAYNDGSVLYIPPAMLATHCEIDLTYFPFDTQLCLIKIGSWVFDGTVVDLDFYEGLKEIDLSDYSTNRKWKIIRNTAKLTTKYYPCCSEPYPDITFNLTLRRNPAYYTYLYIGPAAVLSMLAPFIFLLPPADTQKISLGSGVLFSFTLFFVTLSKSLPGMHGSTPLIDKYYMTIYVLLCTAMAFSTLVSNIAKRTVSLRHPPNFIKKILISCLGRCLCVSSDMYYGNPWEGGTGESSLVERQDSRDTSIKEWLVMATVLDRLFFLVYLILTAILTIILLNAYPRVACQLGENWCGMS